MLSILKQLHQLGDDVSDSGSSSIHGGVQSPSGMLTSDEEDEVEGEEEEDEGGGQSSYMLSEETIMRLQLKV